MQCKQRFDGMLIFHRVSISIKYYITCREECSHVHFHATTLTKSDRSSLDKQNFNHHRVGNDFLLLKRNIIRAAL